MHPQTEASRPGEYAAAPGSAVAAAAGPAGAAYRWVILAMSFIVLLTSFIVRLTWANAAGAVGSQLTLGTTMLGAFVTSFYIGYVTANVLGGIASDRFGARRTVSYALLPLSICTFAFGDVTSAHQGLLVQFLMGLCEGVDYSATAKLLTIWFPTRELGRAFGLLWMASSIAVAMTNAIMPHALAAWTWGTVYHVLGGGTLVIAAACFLFLRESPPRTPITAIRIHGAGLLATLRAIPARREVLLVALGGFGANWGTWGFAFWSTELMVKGRGMTAAQAGSIAMLFGLGAIVAKPLYGLLSDLIGGRRKGLVIACLIGFVIMLLVFGSRQTQDGFRIAAPILGVTAFVYSPLLSAMISELTGSRAVGSAAGLTNAFWQCGSVTVPIVVGSVFAMTGSFMAAFIALAAGPCFGALCLLPVHERPAPRRPGA